MGAFNTKQWSEVLTTGSPGSPSKKADTTDPVSSVPSSAENSPAAEQKTEPKNGSENEVSDSQRPRHRNLQSLDPRSVSDDVSRTPIQKNKVKDSDDESDNEGVTDTSGQELLSTPMAIDKHLNKFKALAIDPRSPSTGVSRTPIVLDSPLLSANSEDGDTPRKVPEMKPPKRGVFTNALASQ